MSTLLSLVGMSGGTTLLAEASPTPALSAPYTVYPQLNSQSDVDSFTEVALVNRSSIDTAGLSRKQWIDARAMGLSTAVMLVNDSRIDELDPRLTSGLETKLKDIFSQYPRSTGQTIRLQLGFHALPALAISALVMGAEFLLGDFQLPQRINDVSGSAIIATLAVVWVIRFVGKFSYQDHIESVCQNIVTKHYDFNSMQYARREADFEIGMEADLQGRDERH